MSFRSRGKRSRYWGLPREGSYLFPGTKPNAPMGQHAMLRVLKGLRDVSAHGFRATFRTWAEERTNFRREVLEQSLAHAVAGAVEAAYRRTTLFEERARLMQAWRLSWIRRPLREWAK
jgi:integrase